jgi:hypothetical protein
MTRCRLAALVVTSVALLALATGLAHAGAARTAVTTFRGTWLCNWKIDGAYVPLAGARVELLTPYVDLDDLDVIPGNSRLVGVTHTGADGSWSFTFPSDDDGDDYWVRVLMNGNGVRMHDLLLPWPFFVDSDRNQNDVALHDYGSQVIHTYRCEVWTGLQRAYDDFVATTGKQPPYGDLDVVSHAITAGVPVTMFTEIWWPSGYEVAERDARVGPGSGARQRGTGRAFGYETAFHEFAHSFRHAYDAPTGLAGGAHFFGLDVPYWAYAQSHSTCKKTNSGFAFNEGWAQYWAGLYSGGRAPCGGDGRDYAIEGNVAAALHRLQALCKTDRAGMVSVLATAGPALLPTDPIHTFDQFAAAANQRFSTVGDCLLGRVTSSATAGAQQERDRTGKPATALGRLRRDLDRTVASSTRALAKARGLRDGTLRCPRDPCGTRLEREIAVPLARGRLELARALRDATVSWTPKQRRVLTGPPSRALTRLLYGRQQAFRRVALTLQRRMLRDAISAARPFVGSDGPNDAGAIVDLLQTTLRTHSGTLLTGIIPPAAPPPLTRVAGSSGTTSPPVTPDPPRPPETTPTPEPPPPPPAPKPNLVVVAIKGFHNASDPKLSLIIRNTGSTAAPASRLGLLLHSLSDNKDHARTLDVPALAAGAEVTITHPCTDPYAPDRATATVDAPGTIDEADESDNALTVTGPPCRYD